MQQRWRLPEYLLKGTYLGLALLAAATVSDLKTALILAGAALVGLGLPILIAEFTKSLPSPTGAKISASGRIAWAARVFLSLIDHPWLAHVGAPLGIAIALVFTGSSWLAVLTAAIVGAVIGAGAYTLIAIPRRTIRRWVMIGLVLGILGLVVLAYRNGWLEPTGPPIATSFLLLAAAVTFYILIFSGRSEESELEIGIVAILLSLSLGSLDAPRTVRSLVVLLPVGLYVVYCERMRRNLVVFKHVVRGMEHERRADWEPALVEYRLALAGDPSSELAKSGSWRVHGQIDVDRLTEGTGVWELVDPVACLQRAHQLIEQAQPARQPEARRLLELVDRRDPTFPCRTRYRRLRSLLADRQFDSAKALLSEVTALDSAAVQDLSNEELEAHFKTWCLLLRDPALASVSAGWMREKGNLVALLILIEERLKRAPNDQEASEFKTFLYRQLTWSVFAAYREGRGNPVEIDYPFCRTTARELNAAEGNPAAAVDLARIAREGLPAERLSLGVEIAELLRSQNSPEAIVWYRAIFDEGCARKGSELGANERAALDTSARVLALDAEARGAEDSAVRYWEVFAAGPSAGIETRRRLLRLYEKQGNRISAIRHVEAALAFGLSDADRKEWREARERLYRSVDADELRPRLSEAERYFNFRFALANAQQIMEQNGPQEDLEHYLALAELGGNEILPLVNFLLGRVQLRNGEWEQAAQCLEQVVTTDEKARRDKEINNAYYRACRMLGEVYVRHLAKPERAIECLTIYKDHLDSGAETLYLLGEAYEAAGKVPQARKWYDMVLVYPSHPRAADARSALGRLGSSAKS